MSRVQEKPKQAMAEGILGTPEHDLRMRVRGNGLARTLRIRKRKCTIGSAQQCTFQLAGPAVPPVQCLILRGTRGDFVRRLADQPGHRPRLVDSQLKPGDRLWVGTVEFQVLDPIGDPPARRPVRRATESTRLLAMIESRMKRLEDQLGELQRQPATIESSHLKETVDYLTAKLKSEQDDFYGQHRELERERDQLAAQLETCTQQLADTQVQLDHDRARQREIEQRQEEAEQHLLDLRYQLQQLGVERDAAIEQHDQERAQWDSEKYALQQELVAKSNQIQLLQTQCSSLDKQRDQLEVEQARLESVVTELRLTFEQLQEQLNSQQQDFAEQREDWNKQRRELETRLADAESQLDQTQSRLAEHQQAAQEHERLGQESRRWEQQCQQLTRQLATAQEDCQRHQSEAEELAQRCDELNDRLKELEELVETLEQERENQTDPQDDPSTASVEEIEHLERQHQHQREAWEAERKWFQQELDTRQQQIEQLDGLRHASGDPPETTSETSPANSLDTALEPPSKTLEISPDLAGGAQPILPPSPEAQLQAAPACGADRPAENLIPQPPTDADCEPNKPNKPKESSESNEPNEHHEPSESGEATSFASSADYAPVTAADVLARFGQSQACQEDELEPHESEPAAIPDRPSTRENSDEESIEQYMNRLLARVRGADSGPHCTAPCEPQRTPIIEEPWPEEPPSREPVEHEVVEPPDSATPAQPDSWMPRRQAPEMSDRLAAMRDLANESTRSAIASHAQRNSSDVIIAKLLWAGGALGGALGCLWLPDTAPRIRAAGLVVGLLVAAWFSIQAMSLRRRLLQSLVLAPAEKARPEDAPAEAEGGEEV